MRPHLTVQSISAILSEIAVLLELKGDNPFKIRAYENGARVVDSLGEQLFGLVAEGKLAGQKGIGSALSEKISELVDTGRLRYFEELRREFPQTIFELLQIPGLGPRKVRLLYQQLDIRTLGELEYACHENRLTSLEGFGPKSQTNVLDGIGLLKKHRGLYLFSEAMNAAQELLSLLKTCTAIQRVSLAGSLRRRKETVKDIDIVASSDSADTLMKHFVGLSIVSDIIAHGQTKSSIRLDSGLQVDLRVVNDQAFPFALHHFTGSKEHNTALRGLAKTQGLKINEYGLFRGTTRLPCADEAALFKALEMDDIPPELRENFGEIEAASSHTLPSLVTERDIKGIFHAHTTDSDGRHSLEEMVTAASALGYQYIGISDHSRTAHYAHGLSIDRIRAQHQAIASLQDRCPDITILKGIESDILPDGSLDYPDSVLKCFDFVIASVHSQFTMTEEAMTKRIVTAMSHPAVTMLGHPTGRLLLSREPYQLNLQHVLEAAKRYRVVIELNANPHRLDLDWRFCKYARDLGVKFSINPDAHSTDGLENVQYGVGIARKGWLAPADIINTESVETLRRTVLAGH